MKMKNHTYTTEIATIDDVPALLDLQRKAFRSQCIECGWEDAPPMTETLEHAYEEFTKYLTLKIQTPDGQIIGSVRGNVTDGSLYIGRVMVDPDYWQQGLGKLLCNEIQARLPHKRAWLYICKQISSNYEFYLSQGFKIFKTVDEVEHGLTWAYMEK